MTKRWIMRVNNVAFKQIIAEKTRFFSPAQKNGNSSYIKVAQGEMTNEAVQDKDGTPIVMLWSLNKKTKSQDNDGKYVFEFKIKPEYDHEPLSGDVYYNYTNYKYPVFSWFRSSLPATGREEALKDSRSIIDQHIEIVSKTARRQHSRTDFNHRIFP